MDTPKAQLESSLDAKQPVSFLELVVAVQDAAHGDAEVTATLRHMFETRHVRFDRRCPQRPPQFQRSP
jgi:hypothetical protein